MATSQTSSEAAEGAIQNLEASEFTALLSKQIKPKSDSARDEVSRAVRTFAEQAISASVTIAADVTQTIKDIIA